MTFSFHSQTTTSKGKYSTDRTRKTEMREILPGFSQTVLMFHLKCAFRRLDERAVCL